MNTPKVGDYIYLPSSMSMSHGKDDFMGGKCQVNKVEAGISAGKSVPFISCKERPGTSYNWKFLSLKQEELKEQFGEQVGYPDPDNRPEFNRWD